MKEKLILLYRCTYNAKPQVQSNRKMMWITFFFGMFGYHRYMMGYKFWWLMFLTMGGLGIWSFLDLWRVYTHQLNMADGTPLT